LTNSHIDNPKELYSIEQRTWEKPAKLMFNMSSEVSNTEQPLRLLAKTRNWKLSTSGNSKLFFQANHPDIIKEFIEKMKRLSGGCDVLIDIIGEVNLLEYVESGE
jgi:hypothetical protein